MAYPSPDRLVLPVEPYSLPSGYRRFGDRVPRKLLLWMTHLGDDVIRPATTPVGACGAGEVVLAEVRPGSVNEPNWGGVVIIGHQHRQSGKEFYSLYGHLGGLKVSVGDVVVARQQLGVIAGARSGEGGWWETPHLHFSVYVGPWREGVLPGYKRVWQWLYPPSSRTRLYWWRDPREFIDGYNHG